MIELIVFDLYGTLYCSRAGDTTRRNGLDIFLTANKDKKIALATDDTRAGALDVLKKQGIDAYFHHIYGCEDMIRKGDKIIKNIPGIAHDFNLSPSQILYLSDGANDYDTALEAGVHFVHVPYYRKADEKFSFSLIDPEAIRGYLDLRGIND